LQQLHEGVVLRARTTRRLRRIACHRALARLEQRSKVVCAPVVGDELVEEGYLLIKLRLAPLLGLLNTGTNESKKTAATGAQRHTRASKKRRDKQWTSISATSPCSQMTPTSSVTAARHVGSW